MYDFHFEGENARVNWYSQNLVNTSEEMVCGQEVLSRGYYLNSGKPITTDKLFAFLNNNEVLLLQLVCKQLSDLFITEDVVLDESMSYWINIPGRLLLKDCLFDILYKQVLSEIPIAARQGLVLEVCEDSVNNIKIIERIDMLQDDGFLVAMDDFGSGYSDLIRLSQTNFDFIKLDLELVKKVPDDIWAVSLYKEIIELCSSKGSIIVSEGVETQIQADFIRWVGVDIVQGFFYSKPEPMVRSLNKILDTVYSYNIAQNTNLYEWPQVSCTSVCK